MKKQINLHLYAIVCGGLLFNYLFWMEKQAINLMIYSLFILIVILIDKEKQKNKKVYLAMSAHVLSALTVVMNQSNLTVIAWYISLAILTGVVHFSLLKSTFVIAFAAFLQFVTAPVNLFKEIANTHFGGLSITPLLKIFKYVFIPIIATSLFCILYSIASPVFAKYLQQFSASLGTLLSQLFTFLFADLSFNRLLHIVLGIVITTAVLLKLKDNSLEKAELGLDEELKRKRRSNINRSIGYEIMSVFAGKLLKRKLALKTENIIGILSFLALNLLLLFLNSIDIATLWLGELKQGTNYSAELHEGTNALIISIIMAMVVILYFFNGNLNFYSKNKTIRVLAYLWIIQNAFLVLSVALRDFQYIDAHGLTYKRIGVLIFLILCSVGLLTVYLKVAKKKTLFYLCRVNGLIWYLLLILSGLVNWDLLIIGYNLNNRNNISLDFDHLMGLSDNTLPLLDQNRFLLNKIRRSASFLPYTNQSIYLATHEDQKLQTEAFNKYLDDRIRHFEEQYSETTWLSWNYRDWQTQQYFLKNKK